jgi:hypothetical protein
MPKFTEQIFRDSTEVIDGGEFDHCEFTNCTLLYKGGTLPILKNCQFKECRFTFEDAAERTINFLKIMYHGFSDGHRMVEHIFDQVRQSVPGGGTK